MTEPRGAFGEAAELPKLEYDIYCPLLDCSDIKRPGKFNYLSVSCQRKIKSDRCNNHGPCKHKPDSKINNKPDYTYRGIGIRRYGNKWVLFDENGIEIKRNMINLKKTYEYIDIYREVKGGYDGRKK